MAIATQLQSTIAFPSFTSGTTTNIRRDDFTVGENPLVSQRESSDNRIILSLQVLAKREGYFDLQQYTFEAAGELAPCDEYPLIDVLEQLHEVKIYDLQQKAKENLKLFAI